MQVNGVKCHFALQEEEEEEENQLAEEAERRFAEQQRDEQHGSDPATVEQPVTTGAAFVNISFDPEPEPPIISAETNRVPSTLPSWEQHTYRFGSVANSPV